MILIAKYTLILFGIFFIFIGLLMLSKPAKAREILRKAGSTNWIHFGELTIRLIPATAFVLYADSSKFPEAFKLFGWFMIATSLIISLIPKGYHNLFSNKAADVLKPFYFQLISPISVLIGFGIIYSVI
jgi:uncharacterized membrane protein YfcA